MMDRLTLRRPLSFFPRFHNSIWTQWPPHSTCKKWLSLHPTFTPRKCKNLLPSPQSTFYKEIIFTCNCISVLQSFISHVLFPDSESQPVWLSQGRAWLRTASAVMATGQCSVPQFLFCHTRQRAYVSTQTLISLTCTLLSFLMLFPLENTLRELGQKQESRMFLCLRAGRANWWFAARSKLLYKQKYISWDLIDHLLKPRCNFMGFWRVVSHYTSKTCNAYC